MAAKLKLFVLEDDPDRIRLLAKWFGVGLHPDDPIHWDCIQSCERDYEFRPPYDVMFLDHDLGGRQLVDHEDSGFTFVTTMKALIPTNTPIIVHSFNTVGADRMVAALRGVTDQVAAMPFGGKDFMKNIRQLQEMAGIEVAG